MKRIKLILLLFIPFGAINSFILFRRKKLNLSEHAIISGVVLLGILIIGTYGNIIFLVNQVMRVNSMFLSLLITALIFFYISFGYINAFASDYTKAGMSVRILLFFALIMLELYILMKIAVGYAGNWVPGTVVNISPFT